MILESERLLLREYRLTDIDDLVSGLNNLNVSQWLNVVSYPYTKKDAENFIKMTFEKSASGDNYYWCIILKSENKVIGGISLERIDYHHKFAGGGIWINEKYHGNGYGAEAWNMRSKFAFETLKLRRLESGFLEGNEKSRIMQERLGYKIEGMKREKILCLADGKVKNEVILGLLKNEWIEMNKENKWVDNNENI